jgi:uncharacterized radical SAM protein YgiQ
MFLPSTRAELRSRGWDDLDVILVSGDAYIDTPFAGVALIGRVLEDAGFRVGIIGQPDLHSPEDIRRLGAPRLFWGVSAGCVDSLVANYTATGRKRKSDDFTPGGANTRRPDRACIAYANLIRSAFRPCAPIVLGGVEASLRRIAHYDFWSDRVRRSVLFDAKADALIYGMADRTVVDLAIALRDGRAWHDLRGLCHASTVKPADAVMLPDFQTVAANDAAGRLAFLDMFRIFSAHQDPITARPLAQCTDTRWLIHNPPAPPLETAELDRVHGLPFEREAHPHDAAHGAVRALDTIRFALTTHRGCYGACNFCAIAMHQGRRVTSRSAASVLAEAESFTHHPRFKGIISDVGGPTANMYGFDCARKADCGACPHKRCLFPEVCQALPVDHGPLTRLLQRLRQLPGVRKAFVGSGIRHDLVFADRAHGDAYLEELVAHHVSGQLKVAPEHSEPSVLQLMGKPGVDTLLLFRARFDKLSSRHGLKQYLTYYFIAAHPGCTEADMLRLKHFATHHLQLAPEQVQVFTPTPSTWSTAMYYTGLDPATGKPIFVERGLLGKQTQKDLLTT